MSQQFLMRVAEKRRLLRGHRTVLGIVEVGEDGGLGELADACDEREALLALERLDHRIELLEKVTVGVDLRLPAHTNQRKGGFVAMGIARPFFGLTPSQSFVQ